MGASKNGDWSVCGCKIQTILVTYLNVLHLIFDSELCEETRLERESGGQGSCRAG